MDESTRATSARATELSIVIPAYQASGTLPELIARTITAVELIAERFELIVVDDGSTDDTATIVADAADRDARVKLVSLLRNFGQHNATLAGIRIAQYKWCVTMDADLQHRPEDIGKLTAPLATGNDLVYGTPTTNVARTRGLISRTVKWSLRRLGGLEFASQVSAFRAFRTELRQAFAEYRASFVNIDVLLSWGFRRVTEVRVIHDSPFAGSSTYSLRHLVTHTMNMVTGYSVRPLKLASLLGIAATAAGGVLLVVTVVNYFIRGGGVPGYTTIASLVLLFSGIQLLILGIIGEYLARVHLRSQDRPPYVINIEPYVLDDGSDLRTEIDNREVPVGRDDR